MLTHFLQILAHHTYQQIQAKSRTNPEYFIPLPRRSNKSLKGSDGNRHPDPFLAQIYPPRKSSDFSLQYRPILNPMTRCSKPDRSKKTPTKITPGPNNLWGTANIWRTWFCFLELLCSLQSINTHLETRT